MSTSVPRLAALVAAAGLACMACLTPARAGLFDDDEARKAILDLRSKIEDQRQQSAAADRQLADQVQQLQRSLLDLNNQNEQLRADNARLRGQLEQTQRDVADLQRKQKDVSQAVDDRLRKFEPQKVTLDGKEFTADPEEKRAYDEAMASLRAGDFDRAGAALAGFVKRYPASGFVDSARYWLGNAQYGQRSYKDALATFRAFVAGAPQHPHAAEALLAAANCQIELKDGKGARKTLDDLQKAYPGTEAAQAARERLAALK